MMSNFGNIYDPKDEFIVEPCEMGGYEASYGTKYTWLRHAKSPKEACAHALAEFGKSGYKPTDLIKSMPEGPMRKQMVSYCQEVLQKHKQEVDTMQKQHTDFQGANEVPGVSRFKAMEYLNWKCENIARADEERLAKNNQPHRSMSGLVDRRVEDLALLTARIEIIGDDAEFKAMEWYDKLVGDMKADGWL